MERKRCLYAGNGFNCRSPHFILWKQMMERLFACFGASRIYVSKCVSELPSSLAYEVLLDFLKKEQPEKSLETIDQDIQNVIVKLTCNLMLPNELHDLAIRKYDDIVTPNYDMCFEAAAYGMEANLPNYLCPSKRGDYPIGLCREIKERKVKNKKYKPIDDCRVFRIWHPHSSKNSQGGIKKLCLQYGKYITNTSRLKETFVSNAKNSASKKVEDMIKRQNNGEVIDNKDFSNWAFCFLFEDVDILGSSLLYDEIDLWWILTYRAELIREGRLEINRITFYISEKNDYSKEEKALYGLLDSLFIELKKVNMSESSETETSSGRTDYKVGSNLTDSASYSNSVSFDFYMKILSGDENHILNNL